MEANTEEKPGSPGGRSWKQPARVDGHWTGIGAVGMEGSEQMELPCPVSLMDLGQKQNSAHSLLHSQHQVLGLAQSSLLNERKTLKKWCDDNN